MPDLRAAGAIGRAVHRVAREVGAAGPAPRGGLL